ncbi:MAG: AraC family transcriptional regulator [Lachnospiraceae bacterium]|nr:AraC family transcriptional regulator [Lachnospiraceae bacterium]
MSNRRYDLKTDSPEESILQGHLLYVASAMYDTDWNSVLHTHYFTELFYVRRGKGSFQMGNEIFDVFTDDLVLISPHTEHTERSSNAEPLEYIVLGVEGLTFARPDGSPLTYGKINCRSDHATIRFCLDTMVREMQLNSVYQTTLCQQLLNVVLIYVLRTEKMHLTVASLANASREISIVKEYIDSHFKSTVTLNELAQTAHLNKYYLVHHFTQTYGLSPINYLLERRVEECKRLLSSTDYSISQIAQFTGFSSGSYFSQRFRTSTGMTPQQYRRQFSAKTV